MVRTTRLLLAWAVLGVAATRGTAQAPQTLPGPTPLFPEGRGTTGTGPASGGAEPAILRELPVIPDLPASLYQPALPPAPPPPLADRPYFGYDPSLDPPEWSQPGWFGDVQLSYVTPHIKDNLNNIVANPSGKSDLVTLPTAPLGWVVSPYFTVGYRLPTGFGSLSLNYRFLDASGTGSTGGLDGLRALRTRLDVQQADFIYSSREYTPSAHWFLKWSLGLRFASVFWDNQATEPFDVAAAGSGVYLQRTSNHFGGALGPLFGVEVTRRMEASGLAFVGRLTVANLFGRIHQNFVEGFTAAGPNGAPQVGESPVGGSQSVPMLNAQLGLDWRPPSWKAAHFFIGYQYEHWWAVGRLGALQVSTPTSLGELIDQGVVFQAGLNY